jgi:phosphatidylcholine synthase
MSQNESNPETLVKDTFSQPGVTESVTLGQKLRAYSVHVYTALGVVFAFLAAAETCGSQPDPRWVFVWLIVAALIDATDGPLARRWHVKSHAPRINGRTIDDIVDYLTFTFIPLLLVWRLQWLPHPAGLWVAAAMVASLFGFANTHIKQTSEGFFLGFPSYWNVYAFYAGLLYTRYGPYVPAVVLGLLTVLTVLPVRFVYPNHISQPWRRLLAVTAVVWLGLLLTILPRYPAVPAWLVWTSLSYPGLYTGLSIYLDVVARTRQRHSP